MPRWPEGHRREVHERLDSTNAEALRRAARDPGPLWILAHAQTAGRGRRGRPWTSGAGNFAASLLLSVPGGPAEAALRSFVAALALREALVDLTGLAALVRLKWPNDVLLGGAKVAGILLETASRPGRLVIGFGVNLAEAPSPASLEESAMPPISLRAATGAAVAPEALLDHLAPAFAQWEGRLATEGFAPVRRAWLDAAAGLGEDVTARLPGESVRGRFETIDATGAIVLATARGRLALSAADIHFAALPPGAASAQQAPPERDPAGRGGAEEAPLAQEPPGPGTPPEIPPGVPPGPDQPQEQPPVGDPPAPDLPPEVPPAPPEGPPEPPRELPPGGPQELPRQGPHAARG